MKASLVSVALLVSGWLGVLSTGLLGMTLLAFLLGEGSALFYGLSSGLGYLLGIVLFLAFHGAKEHQGQEHMTSFFAMPLLWLVLIGMGALPLLFEGNAFYEVVLITVNHATLTGLFLPSPTGINAYWMSMMSFLGALLTFVYLALWLLLEVRIFGGEQRYAFRGFSKKDTKEKGIFVIFFRLLWRFFALYALWALFILGILKAFTQTSWESLFFATIALITTTGGTFLSSLERSPLLEIFMISVMLLMTSSLFFHMMLHRFRSLGTRLREGEYRLFLFLLLIFSGFLLLLPLINGMWGVGMVQEEGWSKLSLRALFLTTSLFATTAFKEQAEVLPIVLLMTTLIGGSILSLTGGCGLWRVWILLRSSWENVKHLRYPGYHLMASRSDDNNAIFFACAYFVAYGLMFLLGVLVVSVVIPSVEKILLLVAGLLSNNGALVSMNDTETIASTPWSIVISFLMLIGRWSAILFFFLLFRFGSALLRKG